MKENYKKMVEEIRDAVKAVKNGSLPEGSLIFVIDMIVNPCIPSDKDIEWAKGELEKRKLC